MQQQLFAYCQLTTSNLNLVNEFIKSVSIVLDTQSTEGFSNALLYTLLLFFPFLFMYKNIASLLFQRCMFLCLYFSPCLKLF